MKQRIIVICMIVMALFGSKVVVAMAGDDIDEHRFCNYCGMDRKLYGYSRMLVIFEDGTKTGVCSLHCAVTELNEHKDKKVKSLLAADRDTHELIEAEKAVWVMGGSKRGVMTMRPKWAFATQEAARKFMDRNGGKIVSWADVLTAAGEDAAPKPRR